MLFVDRLNSRQILHQHILPMLGKHGSVLDVGVRSYTRIHAQILKEYTSVDIDPQRGADLVADVTDPSFPEVAGRFRSILFNGMIGFGINNKKSLELSIGNFFKVINGGVLVIGWNENKMSRLSVSEVVTKIGFKPCLIFRRDIYEPFYSPEKHYYSMWRRT